MPTKRQQPQIESLLDEIEAASTESDWDLVRQRASVVLRLDPQNADARSHVDAANREDQQPVGAPA